MTGLEKGAVRCYIALASLVAVACFSHAALANCAMSPYYDVEVHGAAVLVRVDKTYCRTGGMLRESASTGEVVYVPIDDEYNGELSGYDEGDCVYVDDCVEGGTYRFGYAVPFNCVEAGCGPTPYYEQVSLSGASGECDPDEPFDDTPPWAGDSDGLVCDPGCGNCTTGRSSGSSGLVALMLLVALTALLVSRGN